ncbi:hypothetical protein NF867_17780 [Solitalea sp. MAHUQ-68]|uniref:Uncharacterized protein n=1 Tax=Solitalea agri TaxID=2953739 RepID=A0A9X2F4T0_9SPHI|nr:hypothetical protein [Solitalea agri]MCO4294717.1 hypothetical protein [Solitalea agri]
MKFYSLLKFTLSIAALVSVLSTKAQDASKGVLYLVHEDHVIPEKVAMYEKAAKGLADAMTKYNNGSPMYWVASRDDFSYIYVIPVNNYAGIDMVDNAFGQLSKAMGKDAMEAMMKQYDGTFSTHRDLLVRYRADLSYMPDFPAENTFRHWDYYYINPEKEKEAMEIAKEWKALFEKKKVPMGYRFNLGDIGLEPVFIVVQSAKSATEYYTKSQEVDKLLGEEGEALMNKTWTVVTHFEHKNGKLHPDLSCMTSTTSKK